MLSIHLLSTLLAPKELAPDRPAKFHERATLIQDKGRESKLFLTSLLLTSSLVTLALTSLPQIFSLARWLPRSTQAVQATSTPLQRYEHLSFPIQAQSVSSQSVSSQSVSARATASQSVQTLTLTVSPVSSTSIILRITPAPGTQVEAIALPHAAAPSESYSLSVTILPPQ